MEQVAQAYTCTRLTCGEATQSDTLYLAGGTEELTTAEPSGTLTTMKYYSAGGLLLGVSVNGTISYLASDGLSSVSAALSTEGSETAVQLYAPYGGVRYSSGTMPTARGYTGQYADAVSGLAYYGARYYDPVAGQFTSADSVQGPNRYGYVMGNPTTRTDPSGQRVAECETDCGSPGSPDGPDGGFGSPSGDDGVPRVQTVDPTACDAACVDAKYNLPVDPPPDPLGDAGAINSLDNGLDTGDELSREAGQLHTELQDEDVQMQADENAPRTAEELHTQASDGTPPTTTEGTPTEGAPKGPGEPGTGGQPPTTTGGENGGNPGPNFVVTPGGDVITVPEGATGPTPTRTPGFKFTGGSGGNGLNPNVYGVRIMDPTEPGGRSPGYPGGYANYFNSNDQAVYPYDFMDNAGLRVRNYGNPWYHIIINLLGY